MLDPQVVVNLLPELGVRVDFVRHALPGPHPGRAGGRGKLLRAVDAGTPTLIDLQFGETDSGGKTAQPPRSQYSMAN